MSGLCPWCGLWPENLGPSPNRGHSPLLKKKVAGRAEPCLTAGGEAGNRRLIYRVHSPASHRAAKPAIGGSYIGYIALPHIGRRSRHSAAHISGAEPCLTAGGAAGIRRLIYRVQSPAS